jgi:hypothetical protein
MNNTINEELEKKRARQRAYNKKWYESHKEEAKELQKILYKTKIQNEDYKKYLYSQHKISRDKLKVKHIEENVVTIVKKKRGRPTTLPFFIEVK